MSNRNLVAKLEAWSEETSEFHADRQLADEVLLATGWTCEPDPGFRGGLAWSFGTNPRVSVAEGEQPHSIRSVDAAIDQLPPDWRVWYMEQALRDQVWRVRCVSFEDQDLAEHPALPVALCILAVKAWVKYRTGHEKKSC
jgi:hypothetical protein